MRLATWTAGAIALGWLLTAASVLLGSGHPPAWWVVGMGVVMLSFVLAPIGAIGALVALRGERRSGIGPSRRVTTLLSVNVAFLALSVGLWFWVLSLMP